MASSSSSAVHLEHWANTLAPLGDVERASINSVSEWIKGRQGTGTSTAASDAMFASASKVSLDITGEHLAGSAREGSYTLGTRSTALPDTRLTDAPSYLAWYAKQQALIASSAREGNTRRLRDVTGAADEADALLSHLESARIYIAELRAGAKLVEEGTEGLREDAESMVERIDHLSQLAEALSLRLSYFALLPSTTSFLSSPSLSLVTTPEFHRTLDRLDVALAFVRAHSRYRDAALFKMRFEHCVVRAGTLIRMFVLGRLKEVLTDSSIRLREWERERHTKGKEKGFDVEEHAMMTLEDPALKEALWTRFENEGDNLRSLLLELEKRSAADSEAGTTEFGSILTFSDDTAAKDDVVTTSQGKGHEQVAQQPSIDGEETVDVFRAPEFASLLNECRTTYFEARKALISGMIANCVARMEVAAVHPASAGQSESGTMEKDGETATSRLVDRSMIFLAALNDAESALFSRFFTTNADEARLANVAALHAHIRALSTPIDDRLKPRLTTDGGLAGLSSATLRAIDTWREYFVRFLS